MTSAGRVWPRHCPGSDASGDETQVRAGPPQSGTEHSYTSYYRVAWLQVVIGEFPWLQHVMGEFPWLQHVMEEFPWLQHVNNHKCNNNFPLYSTDYNVIREYSLPKKGADKDRVSRGYRASHYIDF